MYCSVFFCKNPYSSLTVLWSPHFRFYSRAVQSETAYTLRRHSQQTIHAPAFLQSALPNTAPFPWTYTSRYDNCSPYTLFQKYAVYRILQSLLRYPQSKVQSCQETVHTKSGCSVPPALLVYFTALLKIWSKIYVSHVSSV